MSDVTRINTRPPHRGRPPVTGVDGDKIRKTITSFAAFVAKISSEQQMLDDTTKASLALEQAKREYIDFVGELQKSRDYTEYTSKLNDWKGQTEEKYIGALKSEKAQKMFQENFNQFYTQGYSQVSQLGIERTVSDAVSMAEHLSKVAAREGTKLSLDTLAEYLKGKPNEKGERVGGIVGYAMDEGQAETLMYEAIHGAYLTKARKEIFAIAEKETYDSALNFLNKIDDDGNYVNYPKLTLAERVQIGEALEDELGDRRTREQFKTNDRESAVYREVTQLWFEKDKEGNPKLTRRMMNRPGGYKDQLSPEAYVQIMQMMNTAESQQQTSEKNQFDEEVQLEVIKELNANTGKEELAARITGVYESNPGAGTVQGYQDALDLNRQDDSRPHYTQQALDKLEANLGNVPEAIYAEAERSIASWIRHSWMEPDGRTFKLEADWKQKPEDLMKYTDTLIDLMGEKVRVEAQKNKLFFSTPGKEPNEWRNFSTVYKGIKSKALGTADRRITTAIEQNFIAMQSGLYLTLSGEAQQELQNLADYRSYVATKQFEEKGQLKDLIESNIIPSTWKRNDIAFDPKRDVFQSPLTLNPIIRVRNPVEGKELELTLAWSEALEEEIWVRYNRQEEEQVMKEWGLNELLKFNPVSGTIVGAKEYKRYQTSRDTFWEQTIKLYEAEEEE